MPLEQLMKKLRQDLEAMSEMVEKNVNDAIMALIERSEELAQEVIDYDIVVDETELEVYKHCSEALNLPGAKVEDHRFVFAAIKIATELEAIGDLAVDIAEHVRFLLTKRSIQADLTGFAEMLEFTSMMVRDSVLSLLESNEELAWRVCAHDDLVDEAFKDLEGQLLHIAEGDSSKAIRAMHLLVAAIDLERIANNAASIAEDVIYILEGKLVHHHIDEWRKRLAPELDKRRRKKKRDL